MVSNTVFKLTFKHLEKDLSDEYVAFFVSEDDNVISNKRVIKLSPSNEECTVGFILNSGVDFTVMNNCKLVIEKGDIKIGELFFEMKISFYSDF